ncbi:MAG: hypothetical protein AABY22_18105 [Nanoarchaeota archaeon]
MATFIENRLGKIRIVIDKRTDLFTGVEKTVLEYKAETKTDKEERVRTLTGDLFDELTPVQKTKIDDIINLIEAKIKTKAEII